MGLEMLFQPLSPSPAPLAPSRHAETQSCFTQGQSQALPGPWPELGLPGAMGSVFAQAERVSLEMKSCLLFCSSEVNMV